MISRLQSEYTGRVAEIWLEGNLNAHCFIPAQYWRDNFELVKELLGQAEVYVYEDARQIQGFIGLMMNILRVFSFLMICGRRESENFYWIL